LFPILLIAESRPPCPNASFDSRPHDSQPLGVKVALLESWCGSKGLVS